MATLFTGVSVTPSAGNTTSTEEPNGGGGREIKRRSLKIDTGALKSDAEPVSVSTVAIRLFCARAVRGYREDSRPQPPMASWLFLLELYLFGGDPAFLRRPLGRNMKRQRRGARVRPEIGSFLTADSPVVASANMRSMQVHARLQNYQAQGLPGA